MTGRGRGSAGAARALAALALTTLLACGGGGEPLDGGASAMDGGGVDGGSDDGAIDAPVPPIDVPADRADAFDCDGSMADGCACSDVGYAWCLGGMGWQCCHGVWQSFHDGPCYPPPDGGLPACGTSPQEGCACATEGETACRFTDWRLVCRDGTWREDVGRVCC